jgi:uncharacterized protein YndB with AHSA1/START domain
VPQLRWELKATKRLHFEARALICNLMVAKIPSRIEKHIVLKAPRSRVWRALTDAREFGTWFGAGLSGTFEAGATLEGKITTPGYDHLTMRCVVERVQPEELVSFRWHPHAVEPSVDYSDEPMTLVEFRLADAPEGATALSVTESGFENVPLARRAKAFEMNSQGWGIQLENISRHVTS